MLYELPAVEYLKASSVDEVVYWLGVYGERAKILAGGNDLLALMKDRIRGPKLPQPKLLISVRNIPRMNRIEVTPEGGLVIGAATPIAEVEASELIQRNFAALAEAATEVAFQQMRSTATVGGNLCQRPWCGYFRSPYFNCFKKGGDMCYAEAGDHRYYFSIFQHDRCIMAHPSDLAVALLAFDAKIRIFGGRGERLIPVESFFLGGGDLRETVLSHDEIITEIEVPPSPSNVSRFAKVKIRDSWDFALVSAAASVRVENHVCEHARIVLGGVAPYPYRAVKAEDAVRGKHVDRSLIDYAARVTVADAKPLTMNHYKVDLVKNTVERLLSHVFGLEA